MLDGSASQLPTWHREDVCIYCYLVISNLLLLSTVVTESVWLLSNFEEVERRKHKNCKACTAFSLASQFMLAWRSGHWWSLYRDCTKTALVWGCGMHHMHIVVRPLSTTIHTSTIGLMCPSCGLTSPQQWLLKLSNPTLVTVKLRAGMKPA